MYLCYVAGPYRGLTPAQVRKNIEAAESEAAYLWQNSFSVICPHKNTEGLERVIFDQDVFIEGDKVQVVRSDILILLDNWHLSVGSTKEKAAMDDAGGLVLHRSRAYDVKGVQGYLICDGVYSTDAVYLREGKTFLEANNKEYIHTRKQPLLIGAPDDLKPTSP